MGAEGVAVLVEPGAQSRPFADQRLVGDLDGRLVRGGIVVEGQEARATEPVDG